MTKAKLLGFSLLKKNGENAKKAKKKLFQQITSHKLEGKNSYSKPDRFALARFARASLGGASIGGASLGGASLGGASLGGNKDAPYRSRAAFKLLEIEGKYRFCAEKKRILDIGAAPGGWLQVALEVAPNAKLLGIDKKAIAPLNENRALERLHIMQEDLQKSENFPTIVENIVKILGAKPDCILSDIAPDTIGQTRIDNDRFASLIEEIMPLVYQSLAPNGDFLTKLRHSAGEKNLLNTMKSRFASLHLIKPQASRKSANEIYLLAKSYKPLNAIDPKARFGA